MEPGRDIEDAGDDLREHQLGCVAVVREIEDATRGAREGWGGRWRARDEGGGEPGGFAGVADVHGVDAQLFAVEPFHFFLLCLVHSCQAQTPG